VYECVRSPTAHRQVNLSTWFLRSGEVGVSQGISKYQGAKVNKDAEKILTSKFFPLASLADYLYFHF